MVSNNSIEINDLVFGWDKHLPPIIHIPKWTVKHNDSVFLHGPSGTGKSTLLNIVCGILAPDEGKVDVLGESIFKLRANARDKFRAQHIGVIFQQFNLLPYLNVLENIQIGPYFSSKRDINPEYLAYILETLELNQSKNLLQSKAKNLSVGQQQRVAVARALVNQPEIIIADEPTSALDSVMRDQFIELLFKTTEKTESTIIFVSHDKGLASNFNTLVSLEQINKVAGKSEC
ncbi:ABC transporter ATP-binding protein [Alteromonas sp. a30]|uniref:ABC transporter ATP-binding protein n=1 Tax=Alteromonas sp. a30 TaxID=2730917 RepID=UPI00228179D5|nr:ABC transporter ATP-binding protein [Alteromonas sp. a30]MCY7296435.1 ABC transporter ATP-binding protein [Alteromonas sp. a30]